MKIKLLLVILIVVMSLLAVAPAFAHTQPPCNDANGDGSASGYEYATHHVAALAQMGMLGEGGHVPGAHHGFSLCIP